MVEAQQERPRRRRTGTAPTQGGGIPQQEDAEVATAREGLVAAAEHELQHCGRRPQFRRSVLAALGAFAPVFVHREGSIAERPWSEAARLSRSTLRRAIAWLQERGVLTCTRSYEDGTHDSAAWHPGPAAIAEIERVRKTDTTRGVHPTPRTHGSADPRRTVRRHTRERREWRLRQELSAATEYSEESYKSSSHPAAKTLRSLWFQKRWWQEKTVREQEQRRMHRRERLVAMHRSDRSAWLDWLAHRGDLVLAAARVDGGHGTADDHARLGQVPRVLHRGLTDPTWRQWHLPRSPRPAANPPEQAPLLAAA